MNYAISKLSAHQLVKTYREAYKIYACSGILFNHESPLRGREFVTKKIIENLVNQKINNGDILRLGNLNSKRDWGHADDYVNAMIKMMTMPKADDYIISTGKAYSIREFFLKVRDRIPRFL